MNTTDSNEQPDEALPERIWMSATCSGWSRNRESARDVEYVRASVAAPEVDAHLDEIRKRLELKDAGPTWYSQQEYPLRDAIRDARYLMIALERAERRAAASSPAPAEPAQPQSKDYCEHGVLWSMECLSCGPSDYEAATPVQPEGEQENTK